MHENDQNGFEILISDVAQIDLYVNNPFHLLQLPVDCSEQEINKRQKIIEIAVKKNMKIPAGPCPILPLTETQDSYAFSDASQRLLDPEKRFIDEYFWFWPQTFGQSSTDDALQALKAGEIDAAIDLWVATDSHISTHNLAVYSHLRALAYEQFHLNEPPIQSKAKKMGIFWAQTYKRWEKLLQDAQHWDYLKARISEFADPRLTAQTAERTRRLLPYLLLFINARLAVQAVEKKAGSETVNRHVQVIRESEFEVMDQEKAMASALASIQQRAKTFVSQAETQANNDSVHANTVAEELLRNTKPLVDIVQSLLLRESPVSQAFHDDLTSGVLNCILIFVRKTEAWDEGYRLLKQVASLARSPIMREKINTNLKTLEENRKTGSDWCAEGYFDAPEDLLDKLEGAREQFRNQEIEKAIQILESLLSTEGPSWRSLIAKPLAFCLNIRSTRKLEMGTNQFNQKRKVIEKMATQSSTSGFVLTATAIKAGQQRSYAASGSLTCMACGRTVTQWYEFTYENLPCLICENCHVEDQADIAVRKSLLASILRAVHADYLRAKQLDPINPTISGNITAVEGIAGQLGISLAFTTTTTTNTKPPAPSVAPIKPKSSPVILGQPAAIGFHFLAWIIDSFVIVLTISILGLGLENVFIPLILYYWLCHLIFYRTIGEALTKTHVIEMNSGASPSPGSALWRALIYSVMTLALIYAWWGVGLFVIPFFNQKRRGLQDMLSSTMLTRS